MASFHTADRPGRELYKYIIGAIVPRPIAFVASRDRAGNVNLSPFSFFNGCTFNPPTLAFTVLDRGEEMKDTARNISEHPEFIVHIVSDPLAERMNVTCGDYGADVNEFVEAGLTAVPGTVVQVPRVAEALVAFECRTSHHLRLGAGPPRASHILGEVLYWHIADALLDESARNPIRAEVLRAVGRMGGIEYARTTERFEMERPLIAPEDPRSIPARKAALAGRPVPLAGK
jgi:flavin reductase (DIM6/NTAB) family NADH-FMN oxidoreductase RutF